MLTRLYRVMQRGIMMGNCKTTTMCMHRAKILRTVSDEVEGMNFVERAAPMQALQAAMVALPRDQLVALCPNVVNCELP
jgi:hypothetical protein